jgi:isoquinoline 1-oxidoreductase beta subunit
LNLDRRTVLIGGGAGIGLIVAYSLWPRHLKSELTAGRGEETFGNYIKIARDGRITVAVPQVETGQGIWTGLPQIVADELGAAWESIAVEPAPLKNVYANSQAKAEGWPEDIRITAGSTSIRAFEQPVREAAAVARTMLVGAAADRWNVDPAECDTADGFVLNGGRTVTFGELAEEAAGRSPPRTAPLRQTQKARLMGQPLARLDGPAKAEGRWRFSADVRHPNMLYASARLAPPGGKIAGFNRAAIEKRPGIRHLSATDRWVAVAADSWWQAEQALRAAEMHFSGPRSDPILRPLFDKALAEGRADEWFAQGNYDGAVRGSRPLAATYYVAPSMHLGVEPVSATARIINGAAELWAPTQTPGSGGPDATVYPMPVGEPAGRAMSSDASEIAIALAKAVGRPVQVTLSQSASQNADTLSPGALARLTALPGAGGITSAWAMKVATADGLGSSLAGLAGEDAPQKLGRTALDGSVPPYSIANVRVESVPVALPLRAGYMRGSPQREFSFFTESFVDELARAAGLEPLSFRMAMLGGNGRLARCLQSAASLAQWDGGGAGSSMGLAGASAFGSHIGLVAVATVGPDQRTKVHKLFAAVDCGRVVNSGLVTQQIEAGLMWAIAQATSPAPEFVAGAPLARALGALDLPRIGDAPEIVVSILPSADAPGGISGLGTLPLAPAVANAIHAGTGRRLRSLPFDLAAA